MLTRHFAMAALLCALLPVHAPATAKQELDPAVVLEWNQLAHATIPASAGPLGLRYYAIMHIAMFDAANSIQRQYTPFRASVSASSGASPEAAAAQAAHDVLVALIPGASQKATFDAALSARLATLPPGRADQGVVVGKAVANRTLKWRADDGIFGPPIPYGLPLVARHVATGSTRCAARPVAVTGSGAFLDEVDHAVHRAASPRADERPVSPPTSTK